MYQSFREESSTVRLSNGYTIPLLGLGTWQTENVAETIKFAISAGYRHIDCATLYGNEGQVGEGLQAAFQEGDVKRDDIFITGKLWNTHHRPDLARKAIEKTLSDLKTDYLDLYLMHWPISLKDGDDMFPTDDDGNFIFEDNDYLDAYKAMESMVDEGLTRSIGVSNFNRRQIQRILDNCRIKPVVNQVECHPYLNQQRLHDYCREKGIVLSAYSPLCSPGRPWAKPTEPKLLEDPKVIEIAKTHNKSVGQVLIRYLIQRRIPVLPKSSNPERLQENLKVTDFNLSFGDMEVLNGMNGFRSIAFPPWNVNKNYPFSDDF